MNKNLLATAGVLCGLLIAGAAMADGEKAATPAAATDAAAKEAMMAEMMKYANPGPQHEMLKPMVGTWNAVVKSWTGGPEPTVNKGVMKNSMMLGGRYLESRYKGTYDGKPFEGYGLTGYDLKKNQLISFWIDDMSTSWMTTSGGISADGKELTGTGTVDGMDGKPMAVRTVTKIEGPAKHVYTMYGTMNGQEMPMMEITYDLATNKK
jgi:hypothetical protein